MPASRYHIGFAVLTVALFHAALLASGATSVSELADMDAYARVLRLRQLWETGAWHDPVLRALGAPSGTEMHWGRAVDLLALPFAAAAGIDTVALLFAPVLHALAAAALVAGGARVLPRWALWLLPPLFLTQRNLTHYFDLGYFDHHAVLGATTIAVTALMLAHLSSGRTRPLAAAALLCGFATWATPEGLLIAAPPVLALAVLWVWRGAGHLRALRTFGLSLSAALALGLLAERPPADWLSAEVDRLSIVHLTAATLVTLLAVLAERLAYRRWLVAGGAAIVGAAALLALFPQLLAGGYGDVAPEVRWYLIANVPGDDPLLPLTPDLAYNFLLDLGYAFPALGWALWALRRDAQPRHVLYIAQLALYLPLAMAVARLSLYVEAALLLPLAECLVGLLKRRAALLAVALGPAVAALGVRAVWLEQAHPVGGGCRYGALAPFLNEPATILTPLLAAPEIAYRTGLPTVGGPFHRDEAGIRDTMILFYGAPDDPLLRQVARQRRLGHVALCRHDLPGADLSDTMLGRLVERRPPPWMTEAPLPAELARRFLLYRVRP